MGKETDRVMRELLDFVNDKVITLVVVLTNTLFEDTPELTGFAETNWIPSIGKSFDDTVGSKQLVSKSAQDAGLAIVRATYAYPDTVFITNNADYIELLNIGSSTKAPAFFVQTAIAKSIKSVV